MPTEEPTPEVTAEATAAPTLSYYLEVTTPGGEPARIAREIGVGDQWMILLQFTILVSIWAMYTVDRLRRRR